MEDRVVPKGWTDETDHFFAPGEGFAILKSSSSKKFSRGIIAVIRSRYQGKDADLDDKFEDFEEGHFYLQLRSPRGHSAEARKLRAIVDQAGERHFSADLTSLVDVAEITLNKA